MGLYCQQSLHKCGCREGLSCQVTKEFDILGQKIQLRQCMPSSESFSVEHMKEKDVAEMAGGRPKRFLIDVRFYYTVYLTVIYLSFLLNVFVALHVLACYGTLLFVFVSYSLYLSVSPSVYVFVILSSRLFICMSFKQFKVCLYECLNICIYLFMHVCMYVCMCMYVDMYVCMYVCMFVCIHVCMYL